MEEVLLTKKEKREIAKEEKRKLKRRRQVGKWVRNLAVYGIAGAVLFFSGSKIVDWVKKPQPEILGGAVEVVEGDWVKGAENAKVTIVEYSDFECPSCASYSLIIKRLIGDFPDDLRVVYRHFPLTSIHKNAFAAALATEAAGKQGKFWQMHDMLFEKQKDWSEEKFPEEKFVQYADELGLDKDVFQNDFGAETVKSRVEEQQADAFSLRLNYTPSLFVNGEKIEPSSYETLKSLIESKI